MSAPRPPYVAPARPIAPPAGASTRPATGAAAASGVDALAFRALVTQVSRHSGARQVSPWTGEAQSEPDRTSPPATEGQAGRPVPTVSGPGASRAPAAATRECAMALAPILSGPPREGRFQLLLPGGVVLDIRYRHGDRQAVVRLRTRHRATARQLIRQAESLALRLSRECLKVVHVQVDSDDTDTSPDGATDSHPLTSPP